MFMDLQRVQHFLPVTGCKTYQNWSGLFPLVALNTEIYLLDGAYSLCLSAFQANYTLAVMDWREATSTALS